MNCKFLVTAVNGLLKLVEIGPDGKPVNEFGIKGIKSKNVHMQMLSVPIDIDKFDYQK